MKKLLLCIAILSAACVSHAQFSSAKLSAAGLTCAMCTKAIYNALGKLPSVEKVDTDIKNSIFLISFKKGAQVDPDALKNAVEDAGFSVSKLSLTGNFDHLAINKDAHVNIGGRVYHFLETKNKTTLDGQQTLNIADRKFLTTKEFKKYEAQGVHQCLETGKSGSCCPKDVVAANTRVYHVTL